MHACAVLVHHSFQFVHEGLLEHLVQFALSHHPVEFVWVEPQCRLQVGRVLRVHGGDRDSKCIGLLVSTGVRTEAEAKQTLPAFFDDERKTKTVRAAVRRYEAHQASKGNGGSRSVKLAARVRIDEGLISGDSDTDSDLAPDLTDQEVDAKYEEMYGRAAASKAGAKTGAESDTAAQ